MWKQKAIQGWLNMHVRRFLVAPAKAKVLCSRPYWVKWSKPAAKPPLLQALRVKQQEESKIKKGFSLVVWFLLFFCFFFSFRCLDNLRRTVATKQLDAPGTPATLSRRVESLPKAKAANKDRATVFGALLTDAELASDAVRRAEASDTAARDEQQQQQQQQQPEATADDASESDTPPPPA